MLSQENFAGRVSLCVQELKQASSVSSGPVLQILKDILATFEMFCQESTQPDKATVSGMSQCLKVYVAYKFSIADTQSESSNSPTSQIVTETTAERKRKFHEVTLSLSVNLHFQFSLICSVCGRLHHAVLKLGRLDLRCLRLLVTSLLMLYFRSSRSTCMLPSTYLFMKLSILIK